MWNIFAGVFIITRLLFDANTVEKNQFITPLRFAVHGETNGNRITEKDDTDDQSISSFSLSFKTEGYLYRYSSFQSLLGAVAAS